jgi:hypothetical protein
MEKFSIEIETSAGWVMYHSVMRAGEERAKAVLAELRQSFPASNFRIVRWNGIVVGE